MSKKEKKMNKVFLIIAMSFICLIGFSAVDISEANEVINACKHKDEGMVRIVDDHSECRNSEEPVTLSAGGGLDVSNLYTNICKDDSNCYCNDENDIAIGGFAWCPPPTELVAAGSSRVQEHGFYFGLCTEGQYPINIDVLCIAVPGTGL